MLTALWTLGSTWLPWAWGLIKQATGLSAQTTTTKVTTTGTVTAQVVTAQSSYANAALQWRPLAWLIWLITLVCTVHFGAVVFVSLVHHNETLGWLYWPIDRLPAPMDTWEANVLMAPFALYGATNVLRSVIGALKAL